MNPPRRAPRALDWPRGGSLRTCHRLESWSTGVLHAAQGPCNPRAHALQSARCYTGCRCMGVASTTGATCTSAGYDTIAGMALSACAAATASVILLIYARSQVAYTDVYLTCPFRETATEPCCNGALQTDWVRGSTSAKRQVWSADMAACAPVGRPASDRKARLGDAHDGSSRLR